MVEPITIYRATLEGFPVKLGRMERKEKCHQLISVPPFDTLCDHEQFEMPREKVCVIQG